MPNTHYVYLKIEAIEDYCPVDPEPKAGPPKIYKRDQMKNSGHENGTIPEVEVDARRVNAVIYREYCDAEYKYPKADKIVHCDINEPVFDHRVPGAVIYSEPGERLKIHVLNGDSTRHTFHVHGLRYGIDSDGSWPFGTTRTDGNRSDMIEPGKNWTYTFDVTDGMLGVWPFHDHYQDIAASINRGLFGAIIVMNHDERERLPKLKMPGIASGAAGAALSQFDSDTVKSFLAEWAALPYVHPDVSEDGVLHVPLFIHYMVPSGTAAFDVEVMPGMTPPTVVFGMEGVYHYTCQRHTNMKGTVTVAVGGAATAEVRIKDFGGKFGFDPIDVRVRPGGSVTWQPGSTDHTATEDGSGIPSWCVNGRTYVGNTPTILAQTGQRIRWYVCNLDLGGVMHNFHTHGQRWKYAGETMDARSIGPAESFVVETIAPPVLLLPDDIKAAQDPENRPEGAEEYTVHGDFLFHCHVEMHMMSGLTGLVRSEQKIWMTDEQRARLEAETGVMLDPDMKSILRFNAPRAARLVDEWKTVIGKPEVTMMHAVLLPYTEKVLFWGYAMRSGSGRPGRDISRVWDAQTGVYSQPVNQPADVVTNSGDMQNWDLHSAEHAHLDTPNQDVLIHGGNAATRGYRFDSAALRWYWSASLDTTSGRYYSTTLTMPNGTALTLFGADQEGRRSPTVRSLQVFDPATSQWMAERPFPDGPHEYEYRYYPWTFVLPGGDLFIAGHQQTTRRFDPANPTVDPARTWDTKAGDRSRTRAGGERGTAVMLPLRPQNGYGVRILIAAGDHRETERSAEIIDLSIPSPRWEYVKPISAADPLHASLHYKRAQQANAVLLPDGRVMLAGGVEPRNGVGPGPVEIFDPTNPAGGWTTGASMTNQRLYHSAALLLPDGSVLMGGDPNDQGISGDQMGAPTEHERYYPWYFQATRPTITSAPADARYQAQFDIVTPDAAAITEVALIRPGAVTHGFNMSQRYVECTFAVQDACDDSGAGTA